MKLFKGDISIDLWDTTKDDVHILRGELKNRRGRPRKIKADEYIPVTGEEDEREIQEILGERTTRNKNGLVESQYNVRWSSNGTTSWI